MLSHLHMQKKRTAYRSLHILTVHMAALRITKIYFLGGRVHGLPLFTAPSSHQMDSWLGLDVPPNMQWAYEASCFDVPSTATCSQYSGRSPGCMMSEGGGGQHLYKCPRRLGR